MGQRGAHLADVAFEDCRIPATALLGREGREKGERREKRERSGFSQQNLLFGAAHATGRRGRPRNVAGCEITLF